MSGKNKNKFFIGGNNNPGIWGKREMKDTRSLIYSKYGNLEKNAYLR